MKKRSKYRPKYIACNPMATFFGGMSGEHISHLQSLLTKNHLAMQAIVQGRGGRDDWDRLCGAMNMANVLCEQGIGNEFREATIAGRDALREVGKRWHKTGHFVFKGAELAAMNEGLACHDTQLENIRAIDVDRASDEVTRRIRAGINTMSVKSEIQKSTFEECHA